MKTPTGYVALRMGRHVRNCIFLNWYDAEEHITNFDKAEYSVIESLQDAEKYIVSSATSSNSQQLEDFASVMAANSASNQSTRTCIDSKKYVNTTTTTTGVDMEIDDTTTTTPAAAAATATDASFPDDDDDEEDKIPQVHPKTSTHQQRRPSNNNNDNNSTTTKERSINNDDDDEWYYSFNKLLSYQNKENGTFPHPIPDNNIRTWLHNQYNEYRNTKLKKGLKSNILNDEKIERLRDVGIVFCNDLILFETTTTTKRTNEQLQQQQQPQKRIKFTNNNKSNSPDNQFPCVKVNEKYMNNKDSCTSNIIKQTFVKNKEISKDSVGAENVIVTLDHKKQPEVQIDIHHQNENRDNNKSINSSIAKNVSLSRSQLLWNHLWQGDNNDTTKTSNKTAKVVEKEHNNNNTTVVSSPSKRTHKEAEGCLLLCNEQAHQDSLSEMSPNKKISNILLTQKQVHHDKCTDDGVTNHQSTQEKDVSSPVDSAKVATENSTPYISNKNIAKATIMDDVEITQTTVQQSSAAEIAAKSTSTAEAGANKALPQHTNVLSHSKNVTKSWMTDFTKLASYRKLDGTYPNPIPDDNIRKWLHTQICDYQKKVLQGSKNSFHNEKEELLRSIGIIFIHDKIVPNTADENDNNENSINAMTEKLLLVTYTRANDKNPGIIIGNTTEASAAAATTTSSKTTATGNFRIEKWNNEFEKMFAQLHEYKKKYGTPFVIKQHKEEYIDVYYWCSRVRKEYRKLLNKETAGKSRLSTQQVAQLTEFGVLKNPDNTKCKSAFNQHHLQIWNDEFEKMIVELKEYKEKHGGCYVISEHQQEYHILHKWCVKIRSEFKKLSDKETAKRSRLSIQQVAQLTDIGFQLKMKPKKIKKFDEWIVALKEYKRNGGDIGKIRNDHPEFGRFISQERMYYRRFCQGRKYSHLNEEKIKILESLGIDWNVKNWIKPEVVNMSWDDRFQQLLDYKSKHGHILVPKRGGNGLGFWVRYQRSQYKLFLQGKKNKITPEKISKLIDIGFVFDASEYKFKQVPDMKNNNEKSDDDDEEENNDYDSSESDGCNFSN